MAIEARTWARPDSTVEHTTITPELAAEWLEVAGSVEGPNHEATVARYAELMRSGAWSHLLAPAAVPILFDSAGRLRYGIQRLEACVRSGVPIRVTVVRWPRHPDTPGGWAAYRAEVEAKSAQHRDFREAVKRVVAERHPAEAVRILEILGLDAGPA